MNLNLRQLKAFLGVAESSNFTKTAQKLHMSQAALSGAIRELEIQLGCSLFERTTRNVVLTEAGREFLPTAESVVGNLEAAAQSLKEMERHGVARLRVGFTPIIASSAVPDMLEQFAKTHPGVDVELIDDSPQSLQQLVETGEIDAAFGAFFQKASGIEQLPVIPSTLVLVHSKNLTEIGAETPWKILEDHTVIALNDASPVQQLAQSTIKKSDLKVNKRMTVNNLETAIALAEKGFGIAVIPSFGAAVCKRYAVKTAELVPCVRFNYCRIMKMGKTANANLESFTNLVIDTLQRSQ